MSQCSNPQNQKRPSAILQLSAFAGHLRFGWICTIAWQSLKRVREMAGNKEIIHRWYQEIWIDGHLDRIGSLYCPAPDGKCVIPRGTADPVEVRETVSALTNLVSNKTVKVIHLVEDRDWVTALVELHGTKAGTDKPVVLRWLAMMRIKDNQIVESYPCMNFLTFFEELEQLPTHSFELLLGGTNLN